MAKVLAIALRDFLLSERRGRAELLAFVLASGYGFSGRIGSAGAFLAANTGSHSCRMVPDGF